MFDLENDFMQWWRDARFGMMIHWGLYSVLGGEWKGQRMDYIGEWVMSKFRIPNSEYEPLAESFNPTAFDADLWARLAARAGMKYMIVTAKHHDGFAMYSSKCDRYNIVDATPFGRDPLAELAQACKKHGVKLCLYYSQSLDWHERGGGGFDASSLNYGGMSWCNDWDFSGVGRCEFDDYFERKAKPQVTELLTQYGPLGAIWFDTPFTISAAQSQELYDLVKKLQPECITNSRLGNGLGDYGSLNDNEICGRPMQGNWETVATLNDTWGYKFFDNNWKSAADVLRLLAYSASRNVNYVLNIGPDGNGAFPEKSIDVLNELGDWMSANSESIHATLPTPFRSEPAYASVTQRPGKVYMHLHSVPKSVQFCGLQSAIKNARLLSEKNACLPLKQEVDSVTGLRTISVDMPDPLRSQLLPVLALEIDGLAEVSSEIVQQPDGTISLPAADAQIFGPDKSVVNTGQNIGPDGQVLGDSLDVCPVGAVVNWFSTDNYLTWKFTALDSGIYRVVIISTGLYHSYPWKGGHRVRVQIGEDVLTGEMHCDEAIEDVSTRYYKQCMSVIGEVALKNPGPQELALYAEEIQPNDGVGLAVMRVVLSRIAEC